MSADNHIACEKIARSMTFGDQEVRVTMDQIQVRRRDGRVVCSVAKRCGGVSIDDMRALAMNYDTLASVGGCSHRMPDVAR